MISTTKGTKKDIQDIKKNYILELDWEEDIDYYKILINNEVVGLIEIGKSDSINNYMIYNFEIFNKKQGIGGKYIDKLTKEMNLELYPLNSMSKKFWEKHRFITIDDDGLMECRKL